MTRLIDVCHHLDLDSHVDEFEIAYSDYSNQTAENANGITFISGALTPASEFIYKSLYRKVLILVSLGGNPVFRVYDVDPDTFEIMDFVPWIGMFASLVL